MGGKTSTAPAGLENMVVEGTPESHPGVWLRNGLQFMYDAMSDRVLDPICIDGKYWDVEEDGVAVVRQRVSSKGPDIRWALRDHEAFLNCAETVRRDTYLLYEMVDKLFTMFKRYVNFVKSMVASPSDFLQFPSKGKMFNPTQDWFGAYKEMVYLQQLASRIVSPENIGPTIVMAFADAPYANGTFADHSYKGRIQLAKRVLSDSFGMKFSD